MCPETSKDVTNVTKLKGCAPLHLDRPFENEIGRTGECDVAELIIDPVEADLKFVSAPRDNTDGTVAIFSNGENERAGNHACAARERFVFHTALVGADRNFSRIAFLDEIYVGAFR